MPGVAVVRVGLVRCGMAGMMRVIVLPGAAHRHEDTLFAVNNAPPKKSGSDPD
jgi:hypothetical protein